MEWLRWFHGSISDPKFRLLSKITGASLPEVLAVWQAVLEHASQKTPKGSLKGFDAECFDVLFGCEEGTTELITKAMQSRGYIKDGYVVVRKGTFPSDDRDMDVSSKEWVKIRSLVFERDNYTCHYCGVKGGKLECDHVIPVCRGGKSFLENLVTSCFSCNRSKGKKTPEEWRQ